MVPPCNFSGCSLIALLVMSLDTFQVYVQPPFHKKVYDYNKKQKK